MNIRKIIIGILGFLILVIGIAFGVTVIQQNQEIREKAAPATTIYISPTYSEVGRGKNFSFWVKMDSGENSIMGADIRLNFDKDIFEVTSLEKGLSIQDLGTTLSSTFDNTNGTIKYIVFTDDRSKAVKGSQIEVLRVNAKVKSNSSLGISNISFDNLTAASGVNETQNILSAQTTGTLTVVEGNGANDVYIEGEPNSCGGTCGSNYNCKANYFCFEGFCRNPNCPTDKACGCATSSPKPTNKAKSTPEVIYYQNKYGITTPKSSVSPVATLIPTEETTKKIDWVFIGILSAVGASLVFTIWALIKTFKRPNSL